MRYLVIPLTASGPNLITPGTHAFKRKKVVETKKGSGRGIAEREVTSIDDRAAQERSGEGK